MDLTAFGPYALNVRTNISSYGPRARLIRAYSSNTSRLSVVTEENTARISFYQQTSSEESGTGSLYNQSTDDQCVPVQLPLYNRVSQPDLVKWGKEMECTL